MNRKSRTSTKPGLAAVFLAVLSSAAGVQGQGFPAMELSVSDAVVVNRQPLPSGVSPFPPFLRFTRNGRTVLEVGQYGALHLGQQGIRFSMASFVPASSADAVVLAGYLVVRVGSNDADSRTVLLPVFQLGHDQIVGLVQETDATSAPRPPSSLPPQAVVR